MLHLVNTDIKTSDYCNTIRFSDFNNVTEYSSFLDKVGEDISLIAVKYIDKNKEDLRQRASILSTAIKEILTNAFDYGIGGLNSELRNGGDTLEIFESNREFLIQNKELAEKYPVTVFARISEEPNGFISKNKNLVVVVSHKCCEWPNAEEAIRKASNPPTLEELMKSNGRGLRIITSCFHSVETSDNGRTIRAVLNF